MGDNEKVDDLLTKYQDFDISKAYGCYKTWSLIGLAVFWAMQNPGAEPMVKLLKTHLNKFPIETQINALFTGISYYGELRFQHPHLKGVFFKDMVKQLEELVQCKLGMKKLILNGMYIPDQKQVELLKIIINNNIIEEIDCITVDKYDYVTKNNDDVMLKGDIVLELIPAKNFDEYFLVQIISALLQNTSLIKFNLALEPEHGQIQQLVNLILERNQEISKHALSTAKDKTYNEYIERINQRIDNINQENSSASIKRIQARSMTDKEELPAAMMYSTGNIQAETKKQTNIVDSGRSGVLHTPNLQSP
ncbi:MAG: hypothetical protein ACK4PR_03660 [Gammaproteobacteria bacterium]